MDEIKENDYNLNIPRYVDTFEEEEPIDLVAVSERIAIIIVNAFFIIICPIVNRRRLV